MSWPVAKDKTPQSLAPALPSPPLSLRIYYQVELVIHTSFLIRIKLNIYQVFIETISIVSTRTVCPFFLLLLQFPLLDFGQSSL